MKYFILIRNIILTGFVIGVVFVIYKTIEDDQVDDSKSYQEQKMSIEEMENANPVQFLTADGKYNESFWGTELKINGKISNKATVASYKDVILKVTYYSKTNSVIGNKEYTIYEIFPPNRTMPFKLSIKNYKDVSSIRWEVVDAIPLNP
ncbi:hypothetical protein [Flagellimonas halotolerans]|uniref:Secreted protein n=1 Tax=Flagellimonas halotolerans TaxID=3112164 RepID=A0ABU6IR08_9FLAO|nr:MULTISPECIES: hypothetical protein [unclassified Allomuricauda]MEC3965692.1 hypothetical protein [Muricauda sp. SYSU M86414]MEC4265559.1 hypothetical protein [Muricauda sp. SYSU M84420]